MSNTFNANNTLIDGGGGPEGGSKGGGESRVMFVSRDFYATMDSQLSVFLDDRVELVSDSDRYWWLVREPLSGQIGYIPSDIVDTKDEHEAKINRQRNIELTRSRATDFQDNLARGSSVDTSVERDASLGREERPWSRSGFMKKSTSIKSVSGHKKSVSFSESKPMEHRFDADDAASYVSIDADLGRDLVQLGVVDGLDSSKYLQDADPAIDEALSRELGKSSLKDSREPAVEAPFVESNHREGLDDEQQAKKQTTSFLSRLWGSKGKALQRKSTSEQLLRVYAGNFSAIHGYKTMLVDEEATAGEVADMACEKFGLASDGYDYLLSVVHHESHEILQISANYSLGTVIELAKRATLLESEFSPETEQSLSRLSKRLRRQHDRMLRQCKNLAMPSPTSSIISFGSISSLPRVQFLFENISRDSKSDFITHYKFVLNRWLDGPAPATPFYMKVQMVWGSQSRLMAGVVPETVKKSKKAQAASRRLPMDPEMGVMLCPSHEVKLNGNTKMLVNTTMSVPELTRAAIIALEVTQRVPGIKYELYLASRPSSVRDRIYLTKEMSLHDVLQLRPVIDPSGLILVLQPTIDSKSDGVF